MMIPAPAGGRVWVALLGWLCLCALWLPTASAEDATAPPPQDAQDPPPDATPALDTSDTPAGNPEPPAGNPEPPAGDPAPSAGSPDTPSVDAAPQVAPPTVADAEAAPAEAAPKPAPTPDRYRLLKTILGLLLLLTLAWLGSHPAVQRLEARLGVSQLVATGFPFLALGLLATHPRIGILDDAALADMTPLLHFGLGWLGFLVGMQFDVRLLDRVPKGTAQMVGLQTAVPFAVIAAVCGVFLLSFDTWKDATFLRDTFILSTAGAMTAASLGGRVAHFDPDHPMTVIEQVQQFDEIVAIIGLALLTTYFRPPEIVVWKLPSMAWLFVTLGLGLTIGIVVLIMLRRPASGTEFLTIVLGSVAFAASMGGYLHLSPLVICFVVGVLVANLPTQDKPQLGRILTTLERPIHLLFLTIVGAYWDVGDWRGWALLPVFVLARLGGNWVADRMTKRALGPQLKDMGYIPGALHPQSIMAIAIVVSVQGLYQGQSVRWLVTAVVGGAVITEVLWQWTHRGALPPPAPTTKKKKKKPKPDAPKPDAAPPAAPTPGA